MLRSRSIVLLVLTCSLALTNCRGREPIDPPAAGEGEGEGEPTGNRWLRVHVIGDFHGALQQRESGGGAAWLATHLSVRREMAEGETIFVGGGDLIGASPLPSALQHDEPTLEVFDHMGLAASALGSFEMNKGKAELDRLREGGCHPDDTCEDGAWPGTSFPFLAANVTFEDGSPAFDASLIVQAGDVRVGLVGVAWRGTPERILPTATEGLVFGDEIEAIVRESAALRASGAHVVIALTHVPGQWCPLGCDGGDIVPIAEALSGVVDLVVSAQSHVAGVHDVGGVPVVSSGAFGEVLAEVDLLVDFDQEAVFLGPTELVSIEANALPDPAVQAIVDAAVAEAATIGGEVVGSLEGELSAMPNASGESALGDVVTDAQRAATEGAGAQIAFQQNGGLRAPLVMEPWGNEAEGEVTLAELFEVHPFGNLLVTVTMTGAEIEAVLEEQFSSLQGILQVSGLRYSYANVAGDNGHVDPADIWVGDAPLDLEGAYRVTVNEFLLGTDSFAVGDEAVYGVADLDALVAWFQDQSPVSAPMQTRIDVK
jgi:5'-nucleotidase